MFLLKYGEKFINNSTVELTIVDEHNLLQKNNLTSEMMHNDPAKKINVQKDFNFSDSNLAKFNLIVISLTAWNELRDKNFEQIINLPSILILNK